MSNFVSFMQFGKKGYCFINFSPESDPAEVSGTEQWIAKQGAEEVSLFWDDSAQPPRQVLIFWHSDKSFYQKLATLRPNPGLDRPPRIPDPLSGLIEFDGDIWSVSGMGKGAICIPTNQSRRKDGSAIMGAGLALECSKRLPDAPAILGKCLLDPDTFIHLIGVWNGVDVLAFPTKKDWQDKSSLSLIGAAAIELKSSNYDWIVAPKLGCGLGGLDWDREVKPLLARVFDNDDRFSIIHQS